MTSKVEQTTTQHNRWLQKTFRNRARSARVLAVYTAREAEEDFKARQQSAGLQNAGRWWTNRTGLAADSFKSEPIRGNKYVGFFLRHLAPYAYYLEFTHRRHALRDLTNKWGNIFFTRVARIFGSPVKRNSLKVNLRRRF